MKNDFDEHSSFICTNTIEHHNNKRTNSQDKEAKSIKAIPSIIFFSFLLVFSGVIYECYFLKDKSNTNFSFNPNFNDIQSFLHFVNPITKSFIFLNQLLILLFCYCLVNGINQKFISMNTFLKVNLSYWSLKKNSLYISCFISCFSMILISSGILKYTSLHSSIIEYIEYEKYMIHIYLLSSFIFYILLILILSNEIVNSRSNDISMMICLVICLFLQLAIFYLSFIAEFILSNLISGTAQYVSEYKQIIMFGVDASFLLFLITTQVFILSSKTFFTHIYEGAAEDEFIEDKTYLKLDKNTL